MVVVEVGDDPQKLVGAPVELLSVWKNLFFFSLSCVRSSFLSEGASFFDSSTATCYMVFFILCRLIQIYGDKSHIFYIIYTHRDTLVQSTHTDRTGRRGRWSSLLVDCWCNVCVHTFAFHWAAAETLLARSKKRYIYVICVHFPHTRQQGLALYSRVDTHTHTLTVLGTTVEAKTRIHGVSPSWIL